MSKDVEHEQTGVFEKDLHPALHRNNRVAQDHFNSVSVALRHIAEG